ncbi:MULTISPECIES: hypothetical protein [Thalassospira]|nr:MULTISPECIES: hypothetical protein [Thalassospira]
MQCEIVSVTSLVTCLGAVPHFVAKQMGSSHPTIIAGMFYLGLLVAGSTFTVAKICLKAQPGDSGRKFFLDILKITGGITEKLKLAIRATLTLFDRIIGDDYFKQHGDQVNWQSLSPLAKNSPFTFKSFQTCFSLAILYPLIALLMIYVLADRGEFVIWAVAESDLPFADRLGIGTTIVILYVIGGWVRKRIETRQVSSLKKSLLIAVTTSVAVALAFAFAVALAGTFSVGDDIPEAFSFTIILAISVAVAVAFALAGPCAGAFAFVFSLSFALSFANASADAVSFYGSFTVAFALAFAVASPGAILFVRFAANQFDRLSKPLRKTSYFGVACLVTLLPLFAFEPDSVSFPAFYLLLAVPLLFLPFVNGCLDWFSLGITRVLLATQLKLDLRLMRTGLVVVDVLVALFSVPLLLVAIIGAIKLLDAFGVVTEIDLIAIKNSLLTPAGSVVEYFQSHADYFWVVAMLFTTLVPTLIHFVFGLCALATHSFYLFPFIRQKVDGFVAERALELQGNPGGIPAESDTWMRWWIPLIIASSVCMTVWAFSLPILLLDHLITSGFGYYAQLLKWVANLTI